MAQRILYPAGEDNNSRQQTVVPVSTSTGSIIGVSWSVTPVRPPVLSRVIVQLYFVLG